MEVLAFEAEVRELHAFLEGWFAGTADLIEFAGLDMLDDRSQMIAPVGRLQNCNDVCSAIECGCGRRPMQIEIRNVRAHPIAPVGIDEEWKTIDGRVTARISSAVMGIDPSAPHGLEWMHLHEGWLPDARP